jgi:serine/threonine protein kinase
VEVITLSSSPSSDPESLIGQTIELYQLDTLLGTGGAGAVFLGLTTEGHKVAIKVLFPPVLISASQRAEFRKRFLHEAETLSQLNHAHILPVYSFGKDKRTGYAYMIMPFISGGTLKDRLGSEGLPFPQVLSYVEQIADALDYAHAHKVIHRDLKPANILLDEEDSLYLSDFGIAKLFDLGQTILTHTNQALGTSGYMAPEQITNKPVSPATDVYSLATITYQLATGQLPFTGASPTAVLQQIMESQSPDPCALRKDLPIETKEVILRGLSNTPAERFSTAGAFAQALGASLATIPSVQLHNDYMQTMVHIPQEEGNDADNLSPFTDLASSATLTSGQDEDSDVESLPNSTQEQSVLQSSPHSETTSYTAQTARDQNTNTLIIPHKTNIALPQRKLHRQSMYNTSIRAIPAWNSGYSGTGPMPALLPPQQHKQGYIALWIALSLVLLMLIAGGGFVVSALLSSGQSNGGGTANSVITITPDSQTIHQSYDIAASSSPDATQYQASARSVTTSVTGSSQTVKATGTKTFPATTATGELTFHTIFEQGNDYPAGSTFTGADGVVVATDEDVHIPEQGDYIVTVPAHAVNPGASGNIPAQDIRESNFGFLTCPTSTGTQLAESFTTSNPRVAPLPLMDEHSSLLPSKGLGTHIICNLAPFTGGKDAFTQTSVQQSDIDTTATNLEQTHPTPDPRNTLQTQFNMNEDFVEPPQCQPQISSNHNAGDAADQVTVTVNYTCSGVVYNKQEAQTMAEKQLTAKVKKDLGDGYTLSGKTTATITHTIVTNDSQGTAVVGVDVTGTWIFQISDAQKRDWISAIAGKKKSDAQFYLQSQKGIKQVGIRDGGDTLPSDIKKITLQIGTST